MKSKSLVILQNINSSLRDNNGKWRDEPVGVIKEAETNKAGIKRLKSIIEILLNSDISKYTKRFITTPDSNIKQVLDIIHSEERQIAVDSDTNIDSFDYSYVVKLVSKDSKMIMDTLNYNLILNCVYNELSDYVDIDTRILEFVTKHGTSCEERNNLTLNINSTRRERNGYCGNPEFFEVLETLKPYIVSEKKRAESKLNSNVGFIGYFNYLLSLASLTDDSTVKRDRQLLLKFLNGGDISIDIENMSKNNTKSHIKLQSSMTNMLIV